MSATCHVAKEQLEVLPGRSPLGVVLSSARQDAAVIAAVWRHRHECRVPRCRGAARGAARLKSTRRGAELRSRRCRVERPLGAMPSPAVETATIVAAWRHRHECHVPRYRGAGSVAAPVKSRLVRCQAMQSKTMLSSQPSGGTGMSAACLVAKEQLEVLPWSKAARRDADEDATVLAAVWGHWHECRMPRRGLACGAAPVENRSA